MAFNADTVAVRDSKNPQQPSLRFGAPAFDAFLKKITQSA
ncbi:DUF397 domain-containing protein [Streptomyces inhibens]